MLGKGSAPTLRSVTELMRVLVEEHGRRDVTPSAPKTAPEAFMVATEGQSDKGGKARRKHRGRIMTLRNDPLRYGKSFCRDKARCYSCLNPGRRVLECRSARSCREAGCRMKHHPLLHSDATNENLRRGFMRPANGRAGMLTRALETTRWC